jgi:hypothetical protein
MCYSFQISTPLNGTIHQSNQDRLLKDRLDLSLSSGKAIGHQSTNSVHTI